MVEFVEQYADAVFPTHRRYRRWMLNDRLTLRLKYSSPAAVLSPRRNIITNGRAEVRPILYARGDYTRPCYAGRRSVKRELT